MKTKYVKSKVALLVTIVVLLTANLLMTFMVLSRPVIQCSVKSRSLPCESVPLNWAVENYNCANSLLLAMNVTNVKILPKNSTNTVSEQVRARLRNNSYN